MLHLQNKGSIIAILGAALYGMRLARTYIIFNNRREGRW